MVQLPLRLMHERCAWAIAAGRERLMAALRPADGGLLWRTAKKDVEHELTLPPQSHRTTFLTLSAIERHFYMRQHQASSPLASHASFDEAPVPLCDSRRPRGECTPHRIAGA